MKTEQGELKRMSKTVSIALVARSSTTSSLPISYLIGLPLKNHVILVSAST